MPIRTIVLLLVVVLAGCSSAGNEVAPPGAAAQGTANDAQLDDPAGSVLGSAGLGDVMSAKLLHSRDLLSAIALEDFGRIEQDASELLWLSERAAWRAYDTEAYAALSADFRRITGAIVDHARARNIDAISSDYRELSASCIDCHRYLKREGLIDPPGLISQRSSALAPTG